MKQDRHGLPVTTTSDRAAELYREATENLFASLPGAPGLLDEALALDPSFAVAAALRGSLAADQGDTELATTMRRRATELARPTTDREQRHITVLEELGTAPPPDAMASARSHLNAHPKDALIFVQLNSQIFFHGGPGKRQDAIDVMESIQPAYDGDWMFLSRYAFAVSETGDTRRARALADEALAGRADSPYIAHAMVHILAEEGEFAESSRWLEEWMGANPARGGLYGHMEWHVCLAEWELARPRAAVDRYERFAAPNTTTCGKLLALGDAAGLLYRMTLAGVPSSELPTTGVIELVDQVESMLGMPFMAVHACAALASLGDQERLSACIAAVREKADTDPRGQTGVALCEAIAAFAQEDFGRAASILDNLDDAEREGLGGSNVERDLIEQLHLSALVRARRFDDAVTFATRTAHRNPRWNHALASAAHAVGRADIAREAIAACRSAWTNAEPGAPTLDLKG